jgi:hypothetical protein
MLRTLLPKRARSLSELPGNTANQQQRSTFPSGGMRRLSRAALVILLMSLIPLAVWATTREEAESGIAEAKQMREEAIAAGVTDSPTNELIQQAEAVLPSRQYTRALQYARWAWRQDAMAMRLLASQQKRAAAGDAAEAAVGTYQEPLDVLQGTDRPHRVGLPNAKRSKPDDDGRQSCTMDCIGWRGPLS